DRRARAGAHRGVSVGAHGGGHRDGDRRATGRGADRPRESRRSHGGATMSVGRRLAMGRGMAVVILAAYPRRLAAERAARALVRDGVLACATVTPGARAFYRWKGKDRAG